MREGRVRRPSSLDIEGLAGDTICEGGRAEVVGVERAMMGSKEVMVVRGREGWREGGSKA